MSVVSPEPRIDPAPTMPCLSARARWHPSLSVRPATSPADGYRAASTGGQLWRRFLENLHRLGVLALPGPELRVAHRNGLVNGCDGLGWARSGVAVVRVVIAVGRIVRGLGRGAR